MDTEFAAVTMTNATCLCVGSITRREAENLRADGHDDDGKGFYLYLANQADPSEPIEILGKFFSAFEANRFAELAQS